MNFKNILIGLLILICASCVDQELVNTPLIDAKEVLVRVAGPLNSRLCYEDGDSITLVHPEIGDSITLYTQTQGNLDFVSTEREDDWYYFSPVDKPLKAIEGESVYLSYPVSTIDEDGNVAIPATNVWKGENKSPFVYGISSIENSEVTIYVDHPFSILNVSLEMDVDDIQKMQPTDFDYSIDRILVKSSSKELGVVSGTFSFVDKELNVTEASESVELVLEMPYQLDSVQKRSVYIPMLPQSAGVEMDIYLIHDYDTIGLVGCDTLFSLHKKVPDSGFLAGNAYKLSLKKGSSIEGNDGIYTVHLADAGTLSQYITDEIKYDVKNLKISGYLNGDDIRFIREMAGLDEDFNSTDGKLVNLNINDATIIEGGYYYKSFYKDSLDNVVYVYYYAENDVISYSMFSGTKLKEVVLPKNINKIESTSFSGSSIHDIIIPSSVTSIESNAFAWCDSLKSITLSSGLTSIPDFAFYYSTALTDVIIPNSVNSIGDYAFSQCQSLKEIVIPNSVTSIGKYAFSGCTSLAKVSLSEGLNSIGWGAFEMCRLLSDITLPQTLNEIESSAFYGCRSIFDIEIPVGIEIIKNSTFSNCLGLKKVTLPDSLTIIESNAFFSCESLSEVIIPNSVISIESLAFSGCTSMEKISIGDGIKNIGDEAFWGVFVSEFIIGALTPPTIGTNIFGGDANELQLMYLSAKFNIPQGCLTTYKDSDWSTYFSIMIEME